METSLHRNLKTHYATAGARTEVRVGSYRIDVVTPKTLIEIQHGSLASIRDKARCLLEDHHLLIVKPLVARKVLVKHSAKDGVVLSRRASPKRGKLLDLFDELVHFTRVFPHPRLVLEVVLVEIEEWRYPGHGRRHRWRRNDQVVADQKLVSLGEVVRLQTSGDLVKLLPASLPPRFHTGQLAEALDTSRGLAQRIAYCLREMGAIQSVGKRGNALVYERPVTPRRSKRRRAA